MLVVFRLGVFKVAVFKAGCFQARHFRAWCFQGQYMSVSVPVRVGVRVGSKT